MDSPQDESVSTYLTFPRESDRFVQREWPVRRALNFVAGVIPLGYGPLVKTSHGVLEVISATGHFGQTGGEHERWPSQDVVTLRFSDGNIDFVVRVR